MNCPKCHQPLQDNEEYVCCAGATLHWRCEQCSKVSEGFAFPYGRCPLCDGKLVALEPGGRAEAAGLEAVRTAFEIELGGQAFYLRAAEEAPEAGMRNLFRRLAEMEHEHMDTLARRYHADVPSAPRGFDLAVAALYADVPGRPQDPETLFRIAIALEKRASEYFESRAQATEAGAVERQLCLELAAEEREHAALLATEFARWRAGKAGLLAS
jgi:rubrerythrin